jgi:hypothetical protein
MKAGQRIVFTTGEYSDFGITDWVVVLKDFNLDEAAKDFKANGPPLKSNYSNLHEFTHFLRDKGYVADEAEDAMVTVHLGDYGQLSSSLEPK